MNYLDRKACPASTGFACIGIFKSKAPVIQSILPVYLHSIQIHFMCFIHNAINIFNFKFHIIFLFMIKPQNITHT